MAIFDPTTGFSNVATPQPQQPIINVNVGGGGSSGGGSSNGSGWTSAAPNQMHQTSGGGGGSSPFSGGVGSANTMPAVSQRPQSGTMPMNSGYPQSSPQGQPLQQAGANTAANQAMTNNQSVHTLAAGFGNPFANTNTNAISSNPSAPRTTTTSSPTTTPAPTTAPTNNVPAPTSSPSTPPAPASLTTPAVMPKTNPALFGGMANAPVNVPAMGVRPTVGSLPPGGAGSNSGNTWGNTNPLTQPHPITLQPGNIPTPLPKAPMPQPGQSVGNMALSNGNPQNIQNYMTALNDVGAGRNNAMDTAAPAPPLQPGNPTLPSNLPPINPVLQGALTPPSKPYGNVDVPGFPGYPSAPSNPYSSPAKLPTNPGLAPPSNPWTNPAVLPNAPGLNPFSQYQQPGSLPGQQYQPGSLPIVSDINAKTDIAPGAAKVEDFLSKLKAYKYKYKDEADGAGEHISVMAQDLEKTPIGKQAVLQTPSGKKMVDYGRLSGIMLASEAYMNQRLNAIEKQLKIRSK